jgi:hypothetical protein
MATGPIDYTSTLPQPGDFLKNFQGGLQVGGQVQQLQQQQAQAQLAAQQQAAYQADIAQAFSKADPQSFAALSLKYPQQREAIKQSWEQLSEGDRKTEGDTMSQAYSALLSDRPDIAQAAIQKTRDARQNAGLDTSHYDAALEMVKTDPQKAKGTLGFTLAHINDPKAFATQYGALGTNARAEALAPAEQAKANADAVKAAADAKVAASTVPQQIAKVDSDLLTAEQKRRLDEFDSQIRGADSETKRGQLTLEREKFVAEQGLKNLDVGKDSQAQIDSAQIALDNIRSLRSNPLMKDSVGNSMAGMGTILGQMLGNVPGTENKDFRGQLESLKSQIFLPAVQQVKGMGSLSNAEGDKLTASVAALDANMSPAAFKNALGVVERYMTKGLQKGLAAKNVPTQGGGFVVNHPTFGAVKEGDINRLMKQYPGSTREQVITYLNSTGAK